MRLLNLKKIEKGVDIFPNLCYTIITPREKGKKIMTTKQVKFFDSENQAIHGGILINDETLICGCCGGVFNKDEWDDLGITIMEEYANWMNLDEEIVGN